MPKRKLVLPATNPDYVSVEVVDSVDGGYCLVVNDTRVAGCKPTWSENNVHYRWNVKIAELRHVVDALGVCSSCRHKVHAGRKCAALVPDEERPFADRGSPCGCTGEGA